MDPDGKLVVNYDKDKIKLEELKPGLRVAIRHDTKVLHKILPTKVDPLVALMKVEKVPDRYYSITLILILLL